MPKERIKDPTPEEVVEKALERVEQLEGEIDFLKGKSIATTDVVDALKERIEKLEGI